jgi:hypothetical protein
VGFDGVMYATGSQQKNRNDPSIPNQIIAIQRDGTRVEPSVPSFGPVVAVGADDTVYTTNCSDSFPVRMELVAYNQFLAEKWRLAIGGNCAATNFLITDDGLLYFARPAVNIELVAVQTPSPGLARTAWPSSRHDNRATSWLDE